MESEKDAAVAARELAQGELLAQRRQIQKLDRRFYLLCAVHIEKREQVRTQNCAHQIAVAIICIIQLHWRVIYVYLFLVPHSYILCFKPIWS